MDFFPNRFMRLYIWTVKEKGGKFERTHQRFYYMVGLDIPFANLGYWSPFYGR